MTSSQQAAPAASPSGAPAGLRPAVLWSPVVPLVVVTRYVVPDAEQVQFAGRARAALEALHAQPGCRRGHVGRSMDDTTRWLLQTEWDSVGAYRRALSSYDVKLRAVPVMYHAIDEPTAYEALVEAAGATLTDHGSDRGDDAGSAAPGRPRTSSADR